MLPKKAPPGKKLVGLTEWQKFWIKISKENPHLRSNRDRRPVVHAAWLKRRKKNRFDI